MSTATLTARPSTDLDPVLQAVVAETSETFPPERYLFYAMYRPDGGCRTFHAWTPGGGPLGDRCDDIARARRLDGVDFIGITEPHVEQVEHGRVKILVYDLRPILAALQAGQRGAADMRRRVSGSPLDVLTRPGISWFGLGPRWHQ